MCGGEGKGEVNFGGEGESIDTVIFLKHSHLTLKDGINLALIAIVQIVVERSFKFSYNVPWRLLYFFAMWNHTYNSLLLYL